MQRHTLFISDLHLQAAHPEQASLFFTFLEQKITPKTDALYILGDLFDAWIGDDDQTSFHDQVKTALRLLPVPVFFIRGNRDFLIGKRFARESHVNILADPCLIHLYGTPVLLSHGDSLCTADRKHQKYRQVMFHPWSKKLLTCLLPLLVRRKIATHLRHISQSHRYDLSNPILDVTPEAVNHLMQQYKTHLLIHGHTHRPSIHTLQTLPEITPTAKRVVLGAWENHQTQYLRINSESNLELLYFPSLQSANTM